MSRLACESFLSGHSLKRRQLAVLGAVRIQFLLCDEEVLEVTSTSVSVTWPVSFSFPTGVFPSIRPGGVQSRACRG